MTTAIPPVWASNTNYSAGPDTGSETKTDPASAANGFIRGVIAAPQHVNFVLNQHSAAARRALTLAMCQPRFTGTYSARVSDHRVAVATSHNAVQLATVALLDAETYRANDYGLRVSGTGGASALASITSAVSGAARRASDGRLVVIGTGGNRNCYSDDDGNTWTAGNDLGGSGIDIVHSTPYARFMATYSGHARYSSDGITWTDVVLAGVGATTRKGMGLLANGDVVVGTANNTIALKLSPDGGTTWNATGAPSDNFHNSYAIAGAGLASDYVYLFGPNTAGTQYECWRSADGNTWAQIATIPASMALPVVSSGTDLLQCPDTGVLYAIVHGGAGFTGILASPDQGVTWTDAINIYLGLVGARGSYGVFGGRLVMSLSINTTQDGIFMTDGLGR